MIKSLLSAIPKVLFAIFCYTIALVVGIISAYFTYTFYTTGAKGNDIYALGLMAISLEIIKFVFSIVYPFTKGRGASKTIGQILKICFVLSVLASLYYLLLGHDVTLSPASKTIEMLYQYFPVFPLKISQFLGTISLSILIEFLIIYLPIIAPVLFKVKGEIEENELGTIGKIKAIITILPVRAIDNLYSKIFPTSTETKVIDIAGHLKPVPGREKLKEIEYNSNNEDNETGEPVEDFDTVKEAIENYSKDNIAPSTLKLQKITGLSRDAILEIRKQLKEMGLLETIGNKTYLKEEMTNG
jgi:hypothetical protein